MRDGKISDHMLQPCWQDEHDKQIRLARRTMDYPRQKIITPEAEVYLSVVVPAYNEEERLGAMLEEALSYLREQYGVTPASDNHKEPIKTTYTSGRKTDRSTNASNRVTPTIRDKTGWEILVISDGSTDKTCQTALEFARKHEVYFHTSGVPNPSSAAAQIPPEQSIRVMTLIHNRGKGGAVTHGMRHARGQYAVFADADGASKFADLGKLMRVCRAAEDSDGRAVAVGSRAHLVGSEVVVKVGHRRVRNFQHGRF